MWKVSLKKKFCTWLRLTKFKINLIKFKKKNLKGVQNTLSKMSMYKKNIVRIFLLKCMSIKRTVFA